MKMIKLMKFFKLGEQGFSMVQGLMAAAVIGGVSLAIVQQNKLTNQQTRTASTNLAIIELQGQIQSYLLSEGSCTNSFSGGTLALANVGDYQNVTTIRDKLGTAVFQVGSKYNLNQVSIPSMLFTRTATGGTLSVMFLKEGNDNGKGLGGRNARKDFEVNATWNATGNLTNCYSDLSNAVDAAVAQAIATFCPDPAAPNPTGLYFDSGSGLCESTAQFGTTAIQTPCPSDQAVTSLVYNATTRQYSKVCNPIYTIPATCPIDTLLRRRSDGSFDCVKPQCPGNAIFTGLDGSGNSKCLSCGNGQVAVVISGSWSCQNIQCSNPSGQQYFMGFDTTGYPVCNNLIASSSCPSGGRLVANASGNVTYECCTPDCSNAGNHCKETVFASANGCGVCKGTKEPICGDTSTQCIGSYPSGNECGSCTGTKPATPGACTAPAGTSDFRIKAGATCNCADNSIAQERKYVTTCTVGTCGGLPGPSSETWLDAGTQACAAGVCAAVNINWYMSEVGNSPSGSGQYQDNNLIIYNNTRGTQENYLWGPTASGVYTQGIAGDSITVEAFQSPAPGYFWDPETYGQLNVSINGTQVYDQYVYTQSSQSYSFILEVGKSYNVQSVGYNSYSPPAVCADGDSRNSCLHPNNPSLAGSCSGSSGVETVWVCYGNDWNDTAMCVAGNSCI